MLVDSHCHLDFPDFGNEINDVVARARAAGVVRMVTISTRIRKHEQVLGIARQFDDVFCSVGTHPHHAHEELDITVDDIVALTQDSKVVAIGEAGLDYHYDNSPRDAQERGFRNHIAAARKTGLPLVIHSRSADNDMAGILEEEMGQGAFPAVLHCFTGGPDLAKRAIALGLTISFTGILTFKKSDELRAIAKELPADRILVETDAPYLAPGKFRGKRNEPSYVTETARTLAEVRGISPEAIARQTFGQLLPPVLESAAPGKPRRMTLTVTILGCGSSGGVPRPALGWGACDPGNPKNRRRRCSILVEKVGEHGRTRVLVDTSPDLREQLLDADVDWLDAVFITHEHADHTHGVDDLRGLFIRHRKRLDLYLDDATSRVMFHRFGYCFVQPPGSNYPPIANEHRIFPGHPVSIAGAGGTITAIPFLQDHGDIPSLGFRFEDLAYSSDLVNLPDESVPALAGLDVWIVDALRYKPHPSHFSVGETLDWIARIGPKRAILTNLHSDLDFEELRRKLPANVEPAFDGMKIEV